MVNGTSTQERYHLADSDTEDMRRDLVDDIDHPIGVRVPTADLVKAFARQVWDIAYTEGSESGQEAGYDQGYDVGYEFGRKEAEERLAESVGGEPQGLDILKAFVRQVLDTDDGRAVLRYVSAWEEQTIRRFAG